VDNSSRWRRDEEVPLVVSEVNPEALDEHRGIIANPNCSTMQLMVVLKPILDAVGIERIIVSTYQSVSGTGVKAVEELREQTRAELEGRPLPAPAVYPHPIAFNVLGGAGSFAEGDDHTDEERKMMFETRKILGAPDMGIAVTCARVPVTYAHSEAVNVQTREPLSAAACRELLEGAPGLTVVDDPAQHGYPTARAAAGRDDVLVGRIRRDESHPRALNLWVVGDNLLKGAATNAVQLAERLHERGLVRVPQPA
jgi:aspartate-semialdehyde dehydrogenase